MRGLKEMRRPTVVISIFFTLALTASISHVRAQETPVFPVPAFDTDAKNAASARLSLTMEAMREHLCHKPAPNLPEAPAWIVRFNQLLTEMIVAQHVVVWTAAGELTTDEKAILKSFYDDRAELLKLLDKLVPTNEALRVPADTLRRDINAHSPNLHSAGYAPAMLTVYSLAALLSDVEKRAFRTIAESAEFEDYKKRMDSMLKQLGAIQFYVYTRGVEAVEKKAPSDQSFPFRMYRVPADMKDVFYSAIAQKALSAARTRGVSAKDMTDFDSLKPWQRVSEVYGVDFDGVYLNEVRGTCATQSVRILFHKSREADAAKAFVRLNANRYEVTQKLLEDNEKGGHQKISYQRNGTHGGAESIAEMLKDVESLNPKAETASVGEGSPDYVVWITKTPEKKTNTIRVNFTSERGADARRAIERLQEGGYTVIPEVVGYEAQKEHLNQMIFRTGRSATAAEARVIADLIKDIEKLSPAENNAVLTSIWPSYDLWIIEKKDVPVVGIGANTTAYVNIINGQSGQLLTFVCIPPDRWRGPIGPVWGTEIYSDDSAICPAALHAGVITAAAGGKVTIEIRPGEPRYRGSTRNGITSSNWGQRHGSFRFVTSPNR